MVGLYGVEQAVVGLLVDPPESRAPDIGQPRAEVVAKQSEQAEDDMTKFSDLHAPVDVRLRIPGRL